MTRTCGDCTLCCSVYEMPIFKKPINTPCKHLGCNGCNIYDSPDKPDVCTDYACFWLDSDEGLAEEERPDKIGAVFQVRVYFYAPRFPNYPQLAQFEAYMDAVAVDMSVWEDEASSAYKIAHRLAEKCPVRLADPITKTSKFIGPWDAEGNVHPDACWRGVREGEDNLETLCNVMEELIK